MRSAERWLLLWCVAGCARPTVPEAAVSTPLVAGEITEPTEPTIEDEAPGAQDTAVPLLLDPGVTTTSVPGLQIPDGFSTSFGEVPEAPEADEATQRASGSARPSRVSSVRSAASLFRQLGDACPPEAIATDAEIGALTGSQLACAEIAIGTSSNPDLINRLSLALISNALALGDASWVGLVERHLHEIDPANPSLALRLALHHHKAGATAEALSWSSSALEHRADWPPAMYEERTWAAHQVHTAAAQAHWVALGREGHSTSELDDAREVAIEAAREWLEYAKHVGRRHAIPQQVCKSLGGDCT